MTLHDLALRRESCRAYRKDAPVAHETLLDLLRTAILAPNASNRQSWRFYLCEGETAAREPRRGLHLRRRAVVKNEKVS